MNKYSINPLSILKSIWINRHLIWNLIYRDIMGRYKGSIFGLAWSFVTPLLMVTIYTFIFGFIFEAKWQEVDKFTPNEEFALILFLGLIVFNLFSECIIKAPKVLIDNVIFVKKFIFPLEILPIVVIGSALFHAGISFLVWLIAFEILVGGLQLQALLIPLIIIPLLVMISGLIWFLSSLGVFFRDLNQFIGVICQAAMFLSPIFYPVSAIPKDFRVIVDFNPLTLIIDQSRALLIFNTLPNFSALLIYFAIATLIAWIGFIFFQKTRKGFPNVL